MQNGIYQIFNILKNKNQIYKLNDKSYTADEIVAFAENQLKTKSVELWEKELFQFILEWLNNDDYVYVFTSGSTGKAKKIKLGKQEMIESAKRTIQFFKLKADDTALLCLPAHGIAGKMMIVRAFTGGLNLICVKPQQKPLTRINRNIDFAAMTAYQAKASLNQLKEKNNVKQLLIGGSAIPAILEQEIQLLETTCYSGFGMTETITHIAIRLINGNDKQAVYKCLPDISINTDERSCLCVKAPYLYGTIVTNDIVEIIDNSKFLWLGRYDNIVNSGGIKIHPEQIEHNLKKHIDRSFFIASIPDDSLGEKLVLIIEGSSFSEKQLIELKDIIALSANKYHQAKEIIFVDKFIRTKSNKIKRQETIDFIHHR